MTIQNFIPTGTTNRRGYKLKAVKGFVVHYVGCACTKALTIRNNFARGERTGSTQYIIDYDTGEIIQCMPENEVAWHVGSADPTRYSDAKRKICGAENPNYYFIGVECCVKGTENDADMKPTAKQYESLVSLALNICTKYNLDPMTHIFTHTEIANTKECHKYYVRNPGEWEKFKHDVLSRKEGDEMAYIIDEITARTGKSKDEVIDALSAVIKESTAKEETWEMEGVKKLMNMGLITSSRSGRAIVKFGELGVILERLAQKFIKR